METSGIEDFFAIVQILCLAALAFESLFVSASGKLGRYFLFSASAALLVWNIFYMPGFDCFYIAAIVIIALARIMVFFRDFAREAGNTAFGRITVSICALTFLSGIVAFYLHRAYEQASRLPAVF